MKHKYFLNDNTPVVVRDLRPDDAEASHRFFSSIPENTRRYLRSDVADFQHVKSRIEDSKEGKIIRRVVFVNDKIVGDGSLEILAEEWKEGTGHLRLVVDQHYQDLGAAYVLAWNLYSVAYAKDLKRIVTKLMRPQSDLIHTFEELGFHHEGLLPDYVVDQKGQEQDMVIMICTLDELRQAHAFVGDWIEGDHSGIGAGEM